MWIGPKDAATCSSGWRREIPGFKGYLDRELRREVDKMQRDWLAEQVDRARGRLNGEGP